MVKFALRLADVQLQHILAGIIAGVGYRHSHVRIGNFCHNLRKCGVAQAMTKGIPGFDVLLIKPSVTDINTLCIFLIIQIPVSVSKGLGAGIILIPHCPGVR